MAEHERPHDIVAEEKTREVLVRRSLIVAALLLVVAVAALQLWNTLLIRSTQIDNAQRSQDTLSAATAAKRASDRIEDCTTPGRDCFKQSQKRSGAIVKLLNEAQRQAAIYAAACAVGVDPNLSDDRRVALTQSCVLGRLAADQRRRP